MRYAQLWNDHYDDDRHIECADPEVLAAEGVLITAANQRESDGRLTRAQVRSRLAGFAAFSDPGTLADRLVDAGFAVAVDDRTIELVRWERWTKSRAELDDIRAKRAVAGKAGGLASGEARSKQVASPVLQHVEAKRSHQTRPDQTLTGHGPDTDPQGAGGTSEQGSTQAGAGSSSSSVSEGMRDAARRIASRRAAAGQLTQGVEPYSRAIVATWSTERADDITRAEREKLSRVQVADLFDPPRAAPVPRYSEFEPLDAAAELPEDGPAMVGQLRERLGHPS